MKKFSALFLLLTLLSCTCFSYDNFVLRRGDFLSRDAASNPNAQQTAFALGYPAAGAMTDPQKTAFALGYPANQNPNTSGYPPNSGNPQNPNTSGYPPNSGNPQNPSTTGYPPLNNNPGVPQPPPLPLGQGHPVPTIHLCQSNQFSDEPQIFVGTDPRPGQFAKAGGKIRAWVNDEGAPKIAPGEMVDPVTGQITPGDRTATDGRGPGFFLWEPALYITPLTSLNESGLSSNDAENGGKPFFPTLIKGDYNPNVHTKGAGLQGPPIDTDYAGFETTDSNYHHERGGLAERFTAEYIWDVNSLRLPSGYYHIQLVIHDGDTNLGIDCIALGIGGASASPPPPAIGAHPTPTPNANPQPVPAALGYPLPTGHICSSNPFSDEPEIFVGTDPAPGQVAKSGGKIRVWVNDEGAPKIAPGEKVDPVTGQITPGDRTATDGRGSGFFRWEPALYITPLTSTNPNGAVNNDAEKGGKPFFPSQIKGDYNPNTQGDKGSGLQGPPIDGDYTQFENGPVGGGGGEGGHKSGGGLSEKYTAEYIWDINSLGLPPGGYHVQLVIHDGDDNLGIDCIALGVGGASVSQSPALTTNPTPATNGAPATTLQPVLGAHPAPATNGATKPQSTPHALGYPLPTSHLCPSNPFSDEPEIFVGTDPAPGQVAKSGGKIRVWVNDEGAPKIAPGEKVDPTTGQITPGDRTATDGRGAKFFRWEPALYITPLNPANPSGSVANNAENGGKPYYPTQIKGDYNPNTQGDKGAGLQGPPIDGDYTQFENGPVGGGGGEGGHKGAGGLSEQFTAEYIWDINSLGLPPGGYHVQLVIHDGDDNLGVDCIAVQV